MGRGVANVAGGVGQGVGATLGGATTGLGRATAKGFNSGVQNVGGDAVDRLETNVFTIKKQIDTKKAEIQDLEAQLSKAEPAAQAVPVGSATRQSYAGMKADGTPYSNDELRNKFFPTTTAAPAAANNATATKPFQVPGAVTNPGTVKPAAATAAGTFPGEDPQGAGYVGRLEVKRRQAARGAQAANKPVTPNFAQQGSGYKSVNYAPNIKTGVSLPKSAGSTAPAASTTNGAGKLDKKALDYIKSINATQPETMAETRIATALKKPVAEMLQMVETKEDVQRIKKFIDDTFVKHGAVNESAFVVRNQILELVTQVGAQRRRDFAAQQAH